MCVSSLGMNPSLAGLFWKFCDCIRLGGAQLKEGGGWIGSVGCFKGIPVEEGEDVDANNCDR